MKKIRNKFNNNTDKKDTCQYCNKLKTLNLLSNYKEKKICSICYRQIKKE